MLPKKRQSKTRSKKRRTHYKSTLVHTVKCKNTGVEHLPHHAYYHDGILYYKGKPVEDMQKAQYYLNKMIEALKEKHK